mgnify:CR=1 FL=1
MIYVVTINNKQYEVEVEKGKANIVNTTTVAAPAAPVAPAAPIAQPQPAAPAPVPAPSAVPAGANSVKAPMPGTVLDIKVTAGASAKKGQILLILEAMKMENEIVAPVDCTVTQIMTSKGATVNTGDVLFVIQ